MSDQDIKSTLWKSADKLRAFASLATTATISCVLAIYKPHIRRPMHSKRLTIITVSLPLLALEFSVLASNHALAQDCTAVSGTTITITASCSDLNIGGSGSNVTINSDVTIDSSTTVAVSTGGSTNATITNNGTISVTTNRSFGTSGGQIDELINNGFITAGRKEGIRNGGTITILTNTGTISADDSLGINNRSTGIIGTITNSGTISSGNTFGIRNRGGEQFTGIIGTIMNSGTISAGIDFGLLNEGTITALINSNSGRIFALDDFGLQNRGTIGTITNSGTISAVGQFGLHNFDSSSTITSLINTGIISAGTNNGLRNKGTIGTITNSGEISSATADFGLFNDTTGIITALTNSGQISAGGNFAINNLGSIVTLTNTGSISPAQSTGISNAGTITTFNNSQGRAGSNPITFTKSLPTNYNVIVNSTSDFGQIVFSGFSGATNFGVDASSRLANDTTYSSVLSGLGSSDIASGTSGTIASSNACNDVSGTTITISANCGDLDISGTASNVTINSGVTISGEGDKNWTLTNSSDSSGTLWDLVFSDDDDVVNTGTGTVITNSGTISAGDDNGLLNETSASFTTLTNSGTITAADDYGLFNSGTIGTLTNTGRIFSSGNNIGIFNSGTITTLNNSQGASGSALTYDGMLPENYNIIVISISDFGKIVFTNVSGAINFGIDSSSRLANDTTYSSVLSGLSSTDIASSTSGIFVSGGIRQKWTLINSSGSLWDLIVAAITVDEFSNNTNTAVATSVQPNVILAINDLISESNFANMNTYDCNLFGKNNVCASIGGRYTAITNPESQVYSGVLTFGYKLSDNFRVAAFRHDNVSQNTPNSFKLSDKTPLIGALVVWNENANKLGYQLKLANAFQQKNVALTREVVGSSEEGKGQTVIEAQSYVVEVQYAYQLNDDAVYRPYLAFRRALIKQDAFTETGASMPLSFNTIEDKSITVVLGMKFDMNLGPDIILKGSLGVEHDIRHTVDRLEPTGMSGMTTVNLDESFNQTRPVVSVGLEYNLSPNQRLSSTFQYQELPYQSMSESNVYLRYTWAF